MNLKPWETQTIRRLHQRGEEIRDFRDTTQITQWPKDQRPTLRSRLFSFFVLLIEWFFFFFHTTNSHRQINHLSLSLSGHSAHNT